MRRATIFLFLLLILASCQRDEGVDMEERTVIINPPTNAISGSVVGVIFDDSSDHNPISGARVTIGDEEIITDQSGEFVFEDIMLYGSGSFITIEKEGFFGGSHKFNAFENGVHNIDIQLISREVSGSTRTNLGGPITVGTAVVDLPPGNYQSDSGTYEGDMNIYAKWLDPTNEVVFSAFPGNLTGVTDEAQLKALASFGIIIIEIEGAQGQNLQLPEGTTALVTMPIPEIVREFAPDEIELWSFDETSRNWMEEGLASKVDDNYHADVSHFSIWSLNQSFDPVTLTSQLNIEGLPAINQRLKIIDPDGEFITFTDTNSEGWFSVEIPQGNALNLIIDGDCINTPYNTTIDAQFDSTPHAVPINLTAMTDDFTLTGRVVDCDGVGVDQAWVRVRYQNDNELLRTDAGGNFSLDQSRCVSEPFSLFAIDETNSMISPAQQLQGANGADVEELRCCEETDFNFDIDYVNIDWAEQLEESVHHTWEWSFIEGLDITIINLSIKDDQDIVYVDGAIRYTGDPNSESVIADYLLTFNTQGFKIRGTCEVIATDHNGFNSFSFSSLGVDDLSVDSEQLYPVGGISNFSFNLVYFD